MANNGAIIILYYIVRENIYILKLGVFNALFCFFSYFTSISLKLKTVLYLYEAF